MRSGVTEWSEKWRKGVRNDMGEWNDRGNDGTEWMNEWNDVVKCVIEPLNGLQASDPIRSPVPFYGRKSRRIAVRLATSGFNERNFFLTADANYILAIVALAHRRHIIQLLLLLLTVIIMDAKKNSCQTILMIFEDDDDDDVMKVMMMMMMATIVEMMMMVMMIMEIVTSHKSKNNNMRSTLFIFEKSFINPPQPSISKSLCTPQYMLKSSFSSRFMKTDGWLDDWTDGRMDDWTDG